ncbi:MAG: hypothetical protein N2511_08165, partial [Thermodesulfovibrionales bacterium]|nr:hypothetical protein [Thermodesulfovibrionales bacterium]
LVLLCSQMFCELYIPHGSDESADLEKILDIDISFISHMVQMKGSYQRAMNIGVENAIYNYFTTFRLKRNTPEMKFFASNP